MYTPIKSRSWRFRILRSYSKNMFFISTTFDRLSVHAILRRRFPNQNVIDDLKQKELLYFGGENTFWVHFLWRRMTDRWMRNDEIVKMMLLTKSLNMCLFVLLMTLCWSGICLRKALTRCFETQTWQGHDVERQSSGWLETCILVCCVVVFSSDGGG